MSIVKAAFAASLCAGPLFAQGRLEPLEPQAFPGDAVFGVVLRAGPWMEHPELKPHLPKLGELAERELRVKGIDWRQLREFSFFGFFDVGDRKGKAGVVRLRGKEPDDLKAWFDKLPGETSRQAGRNTKTSAGKEVVLDGEHAWLLHQCSAADALKPSPKEPAWADLLGTERAPLVFAIDLPAFFKADGRRRIPVPPVAEFVAALQKGTAALGRANLDEDDIKLETVVSFANPGDAEEAAAKATALVAFAKAGLAQLPPQARQNAPPGIDAEKLFAALEKALDNAKAKADGKQATLTVQAPTAALTAAASLFRGRGQAGPRPVEDVQIRDAAKELPQPQ